MTGLHITVQHHTPGPTLERVETQSIARPEVELLVLLDCPDVVVRDVGGRRRSITAIAAYINSFRFQIRFCLHLEDADLGMVGLWKRER